MTKKILIAGCGSLGSHCIQFLRSCDVGICTIDFDRIEHKNTLSQFHPKNSVGKSKVQAIQQTMQFLFGQKINTIPHKLTKDNVKEILSGYDLVIDCLDNADSRKIIQEFVRKNNIPCLHGALAANGEFGRVVWDEDFKIDSEAGIGQATCENGEHLPFIVIVSAYLARAAQIFINDNKRLGFSISPTNVVCI